MIDVVHVVGQFPFSRCATLCACSGQVMFLYFVSCFIRRIANVASDTPVQLGEVSLQYWFNGPDGVAEFESAAPDKLFQFTCTDATTGFITPPPLPPPLTHDFAMLHPRPLENLCAHINFFALEVASIHSPAFEQASLPCSIPLNYALHRHFLAAAAVQLVAVYVGKQSVPYVIY